MLYPAQLNVGHITQSAVQLSKPCPDQSMWQYYDDRLIIANSKQDTASPKHVASPPLTLEDVDNVAEEASSVHSPGIPWNDVVIPS